MVYELSIALLGIVLIWIGYRFYAEWRKDPQDRDD